MCHKCQTLTVLKISVGFVIQHLPEDSNDVIYKMFRVLWLLQLHVLPVMKHINK